MCADKVLFIDRDGTLIREPDDEQVDRIEKVRLLPGVITALCRLRDAGYRFVMVSNQDGLGSSAFPQRDFDLCQNFVLELFSDQGIHFSDIFICPHVAADLCSCRKPKAGLLTDFLLGTDIDRKRSAVIGDRDSDMELALNLGLPGLRVDLSGDFDHSWAGIARRLLDGDRRARVQRATSETQIMVDVDLDVPGRIEVSTGIGFFDHMLEQLARHGDFSLQMSCRGDLAVDTHHTVEDCALALGEALRKALGDKRGIGRYGFVLPMDEAQARIAVDLSGRSAFVFKARFGREQVGGIATEMVPHFFSSLSQSLGASIHVEIEGENTHHMVESGFKGLGRALRPALGRNGNTLPSTKGVL